MRVLLLAMPDTADFFKNIATIPNLGLVSLAGNIEGHDVRVLDLTLRRGRVKASVTETLREFRPEVVGLSAMTFQFQTLLRVAKLVRSLDPGIRIVAGGYHATLLAEELTSADPQIPIDCFVRGEGEKTFAELLDSLERGGGDPSGVRGVSARSRGKWVHAPARELLPPGSIRLPRREARIDDAFHFLGQPVDVLETSRGCPFDCSFCSITKMYGRTCRVFPAERVVADLLRIWERGRRRVFFVDDNITANPRHFAEVCEGIVAQRLDGLELLVQVSASGIARHPELVGSMQRAGFRYVFVGFESMLPASLRSVDKPTDPQVNRTAARLLKDHGMAVIAGCIVGYPDDDRASIAANLRGMSELRPDAFYAQYLTPYPKTRIRDELLAAGLVENADDFSRYDGFTCNVRTRHLSRGELLRLVRWGLLTNALSPTQYRGNYFLRNHTLWCLRSALSFGAGLIAGLVNGRTVRHAADVPGEVGH